MMDLGEWCYWWRRPLPPLCWWCFYRQLRPQMLPQKWSGYPRQRQDSEPHMRGIWRKVLLKIVNLPWSWARKRHRKTDVPISHRNKLAALGQKARTRLWKQRPYSHQCVPENGGTDHAHPPVSHMAESGHAAWSCGMSSVSCENIPSWL